MFRFGLIAFICHLSLQLLKAEIDPNSGEVIPPKGAFGWQFGQTLQTDGEKPERFTHYLANQVPPPTPNRNFTNYTVQTTPISHKIAGIWASQKYETKDTATSFYHKINKAIQSKYGEGKDDISSESREQRSWNLPGVMIAIGFDKGANRVELGYIDLKLKAKAEAEWCDLMSKEIDKTGL